VAKHTLLVPRRFHLSAIRQRGVARAAFTLLELLVALGIMVVLFAMLFVPMTTSLSLVSSGRTQADMQQRLRLALDQIQRDLNEAIYVYPPEVIRLPETGAYLVNYSTITFTPPARDAISGQVLKPLRPARDADGNVIAVRYAVHTPITTIHLWPTGGGSPPYPAKDKYFQISSEPNPENCFSLYRQQGVCRWDDDLNTYTFGSWYDLDGLGPNPPVFVIDRPIAENTVTSRLATDIPVTQTICRDNGHSANGWVQVDTQTASNPADDILPVKPDASWTPTLVYLFDSIQFRPQRIEDEQLKPTADGSAYWAAKAGWLGFRNDGSETVGDIVWPLPYPGTPGQWINSSEVRPHIVVRRWDQATSSYSQVVLDTDLLDPAASLPSPNENNLLGLAPGSDYSLGLRWNSKAGAVLPGGYLGHTVDFNLANDPGVGFWPLSSFPIAVLPETPASRVDGDPRAAHSYVLDPYQLESPKYQAGSPLADVRDLRIVPESVRVWVLSRVAGSGRTVRTNYSATTIRDAERLGATQFHVESLDSMDRQIRLVFNRYQPPSPDMFVPYWASGATYAVGTLVRGPSTLQVYECIRAQGPPPIPPNNPLSSADDEPGVGVNWASYWGAPTRNSLDLFQLCVQYLARRNFDPNTGIDDQIVASYSTNYNYEVKLGLAEFSPYEALGSNPAILQPFKTGARITVSASMTVGNVGR
jgi:type II secretory pathway pseudopilin PulG